MALHLRQFRTGASRRRDFSLLGALAIFLGVYASIAAGFYWLMQPSSVPNSGVAAYRPPPATIVNYVDAPSAVAVAPSPDRFIARTSLDQPPAAGPLPEVAETPVVEPKKDTKKVATRTAPRRENPAREQQQRNAGWGNSNWGSNWSSNWNYASQSRGSRPWF